VLDHFQATKNIALGVCNGFALLGTEDGTAMRLECSRISACSLSMMRMRAPIGVSFQVWKAR
jgi:phosphoribosylformylglycinamidine (FGAM) synthase-like amidotransferase family enzyme